ncbi:hypothetical protein BASA81_003365 [Batrachochytrium salamandrivorans]|nr:hypothetical protein BASA81_003365 [Batrachochytrium salamandrivorans]
MKRRLLGPIKRRDVGFKYIFGFLTVFCFVSFVYTFKLLHRPSRDAYISSSASPSQVFSKPATTASSLLSCDLTTKDPNLVFPKQLNKLEMELMGGWNHKSALTRILVVGVTGYVKRDLPIYQMALDINRFQVIRHPLPSKKTVVKPAATFTPTDFDAVLCFSFNSDYCLLPGQFSQLIPRNKKINRINHLRTVIWGKHSFCETLSKATKRYELNSPKERFFFPCWVLPDQYDELQQNEMGITRWISKPRGLGAGMGISIVDNLNDLSPRSTHVIQEYLQNPFLLKLPHLDTLHKWDMRTYVLVTSVVPLRAYLFQRGLVRFAMTPYSTDCKSNSQTACLTNTSINKKIGVGAAKDITWPFIQLKQALGDLRYDKMIQDTKRAIGMTLLAAQPEFISLQKDSMCESCFQLLGVDVIFDSELNPKVIECNGEPSMQLNGGGKTSHYDTTKQVMIQHLVDLVFQPKPASKQFANLITKRCGVNSRLGKQDASYLLDLHREHQAQGEFSRIYPASSSNPTHAKSFRRFLVHMSTSQEYSKYTQGKVKDLVRSHDVFSQLLPEEEEGGGSFNNDSSNEGERDDNSDDDGGEEDDV